MPFASYLPYTDDMIIDDVRFELKDGREAILRSPKEEDVESTLEYLVTSARETDYIDYSGAL